MCNKKFFRLLVMFSSRQAAFWVCLVFVGIIASKLPAKTTVDEIELLNQCALTQTENFCSLVPLVKEWRQTGELNLLYEINTISKELPVHDRYYPNFWLLVELSDEQPGFRDLPDYKVLFQKVVGNLMNLALETSDERASFYLFYLFTFIEPAYEVGEEVTLFGENVYAINEEQQLLIKCFVESDLPFLGINSVYQLSNFTECIDG